MKMKREMPKSLKDQYKHMERDEYYTTAILLDHYLNSECFLHEQMLIAEHEQLEM